MKPPVGRSVSSAAIAHDLHPPAFEPSLGLRICEYFRRLNHRLGWRFLLTVSAVYGANQGLGESFGQFASRYLLLEAPPAGLGLTAAESSAFSAIAGTPWIFKAVYGLISDSVPICGLRRTPG